MKALIRILADMVEAALTTVTPAVTINDDETQVSDMRNPLLSDHADTGLRPASVQGKGVSHSARPEEGQ